MATIKKCDICGKAYEGKKSVLFGSDVYSSSISVTDYGDYNGCATFKNYELCPTCMNDIMSHIRNLVESYKNEQH